METKHTPGPWKYADAKIPLSGKRNEIRNEQGYLIAYINIGMSDYVANASLIAQAPNLLAENKELKFFNEVNKKENAYLLAKVSEQEKEIERLRETLSEIRHALYDRDTDDAILDCIAKHLEEAGFPYESDD